MAIGDITFVKGQGGLGRPLSGEDFISGLLFYTSSPPTDWPSGGIKEVFSIADAENAGIRADYNDATAAKVTYTLSSVGSSGDTIDLQIQTANNAVYLDFGTYTQTSTDTIASLGNAVAVMINAGTLNTGFSATFDTVHDILTVYAPKSLGASFGTAYSLVAHVVSQHNTPVITGTGTTFGGGAGSSQALWHYHISEYFRMQPKGQLFVGLFAPPTGNSPYTFAEITTMQVFSGGKIRQIGVYKDAAAFDSGDLSLINSVIVTHNDAYHMPLSALYAADMSSITDLSTLTDLNALSANKVTAVISQDGAGLGALLYKHWNKGKSITTLGAALGAALGAVSFAAVNESIEWRGKFNISNGYECDTPAFANGTLVSSISPNLLDLLDTQRYVFLIKNIGFAGSYFNGSHCAITATSDYAYIENNRTIDKAVRGVYSSLMPALGAPIVLNSDGTLTDESIAYFTSLAELNLREMLRSSELSAFQVLINITQNVLSTNTLVVAVQLIPVGVARAITVNIGFVVALS